MSIPIFGGILNNEVFAKMLDMYGEEITQLKEKVDKLIDPTLGQLSIAPPFTTTNGLPRQKFIERADTAAISTYLFAGKNLTSTRISLTGAKLSNSVNQQMWAYGRVTSNIVSSAQWIITGLPSPSFQGSSSAPLGSYPSQMVGFGMVAPTSSITASSSTLAGRHIFFIMQQFGSNATYGYCVKINADGALQGVSGSNLDGIASGYNVGIYMTFGR